jgi:hypothetical protein
VRHNDWRDFLFFNSSSVLWPRRWYPSRRDMPASGGQQKQRDYICVGLQSIRNSLIYSVLASATSVQPSRPEVNNGINDG